MKIYTEYKELPIKQIKGCKNNEVNERNINKVYFIRKRIKREGLQPIIVEKRGDEYWISAESKIKLLAIKTLGYDKIPCLVRDREKEILLRKINKIFIAEDKDYEAKCDYKFNNL